MKTLFIIISIVSACLASNIFNQDLHVTDFHEVGEVTSDKPLFLKEYGPSVVLIDIHGSFSAKTVSDIVELDRLSIISSSIENIDNATFSSLKKLEMLALEENIKFPLVGNDLFANVGKLKYLSVANKKETSKLNEDSFSFLPELAFLNVKNQRVTKLTRAMFEGSTSLETILWTESDLEIIDVHTFTSLHKLRYLLLKKNKIRSIFSDFFSNLKKIEIIDLGFNQLKIVYETEIKQLNLLEKLYLNDNLIEDFDLSAIKTEVPKLKLCDLTKNKLSCDLIKKISNLYHDKFKTGNCKK